MVTLVALGFVLMLVWQLGLHLIVLKGNKELQALAVLIVVQHYQDQQAMGHSCGLVPSLFFSTNMLKWPWKQVETVHV